MTDNSIQSSKTAAIHSVRHSRKSCSNIDSNVSDPNYIAILGNKPTKLTIKRVQTSLTGLSLKDPDDLNRKSSSSLLDSTYKSTNESSSSKSTISKKAHVSTDIQKTDSLATSAADKQIEKAAVEPLDLSHKKAEEHDRKRPQISMGKNTTKKPRLQKISQTDASKQQTEQSTAKSSVQPPPHRQSLATSLYSFSLKSASFLHQMQQHNNKFKMQHTSAPSASFIPRMVTATPPTPPNWLDNYEQTIMSINTFQTFEIDRLTPEYRTIESMVHPIKVNLIKQIVNPDLWIRFVNTRKEMLRSKTNDLNVLLELGLDERDVMRCTHLVLNQSKDQLHTPYSDNMALLFHCTKNVTNLNNILSQGLDERLSNVLGGRLGKGIYFADDPNKSLQYDGTGRILIFAVLLGDCIAVDHFPFINALVREPEKCSEEQRNLKDLFFDSIVGRPAGHNEYVIYNRNQCCPLYEIEYNRQATELDNQPLLNLSNSSPKNLPPFAWLPNMPPVPQVCENWPFYANELFEKMAVLPLPSNYTIHSEAAPLIGTSPGQMSTDVKLATLFTFGFCDVKRNVEILSKFHNDIYQTIHFLLNDQDDPCLQLTDTQLLPSVATIQSTNSMNLPHVPDDIADLVIELSANNCKPLQPLQPKIQQIAKMDECSICSNEYQSFIAAPQLWRKLKCGHKLCSECHSKLLTTRTTMSGVERTFLKCPFCHDITGIQIGTCPNIQMNVTLIPNCCEGHESNNTILINYFVDSEYQLNRTAYLPNNDEGNEVLQLLQIANDRRLCFTIGESVTTGQKNVLVWGIHHKTSMRGGVYGYPDPGYMDRVKAELKAYGIN